MCTTSGSQTDVILVKIVEGSISVPMDIVLITEHSALTEKFTQLMTEGPYNSYGHSCDTGVADTAERWIMTDDLTDAKHSLLFAKVYVDGGPVKFIEAVGCMKDIEVQIEEWTEWAQRYWNTGSEDESDEETDGGEV